MHVLSVHYSEGQMNLARHYHDAHQILYVTAGRIEATVGNKSYTVSSGAFLILSRFEEHSIRVLTSEYKRYTIRIASDTSPLVKENYLLSSVLVNRSDSFHNVIEAGEDREICEAVFRQMAEEYAEKPPMYEEQLDLMLWQLLIRLYRRAPEVFLTDQNRSTVIVQKIQEAFERDFYENFSLEALSAEYHISPSHLARTFKHITGYAPMEYLLSCRFSAAKTYLGTTDKPIKEIIDLCGFSNESNFSRMFKRKTGMTPSAFRRQYRK